MNLRTLALLAAVFLTLMGAGALIQPGPVRHHNAPDAFDATAAQARWARVLSPEEPHPMDSPGADRLRDRLLTELRGLGLQPEVHERFHCHALKTWPAALCGKVRNIVVSIGPASGPIVLAATHYDSVPAGPGASDAGIGLATWMEVARLMAKAPLQRRVVFLFTEGEEAGLLGAHAFMQHDPLMKEVHAIVNLEARGTRGRATFFESGQPNAGSLRAYAQGTPQPAANSLASAVYELMPNSTDVTVWKRPGLDIVNLAISDGYPNYHTARDNLANFSPESLQHMGDSALGTLRAFATPAGAGRAESWGSSWVYSDVLGQFLISLPAWLAQALLAAGALFTLLNFVRHARARQPGHWRALAAPWLALLASALAAGVAGLSLSLTRPGEAFWTAHPEPTRAWTALLALTAVFGATAWARRRASAALVEAGALSAFMLLGLAGAVLLPGMAIFTVPSAAVLLLAMVAARRWPGTAAPGVAMTAALALLMWAPVFAQLEVGLGYVAPTATALLIAQALLPWSGPLARLQAESGWRWPITLVGGGALLALLLALALPSYTADNPRELSIELLHDRGQDRTHFLLGHGVNRVPPELAKLATFELANLLPGEREPRWAAAAPRTQLPAAGVVLLASDAANGQRTVRLRWEPQGADVVALRVPGSARLRQALMNGADATPPSASLDSAEAWSLYCNGRSCEGAEATLVVAEDAEPHNWPVVGQRFGSVPALAPLLAARPVNALPSHAGDSVWTLQRVQTPSP